ncbi:MAG: glycosyltransferase family 39 protein [Candidatus Woesebacteria bacterium]|nr:glycosyltransferase family 39 protein [Candidatus Woesebacteria bacterium]
MKKTRLILGILIWVVLIGAVVWAGKGIFKYSIFSTHDGDHHIARAFDVIQTIKVGQFPLRWAGSLNYFCGVPIYNFFYPLIYYLVALINFFTKNIIFTLKIIDFGALLLGTVSFYAWIKSETKKELPAIGGALTYLYAPYRFSLIFVRGSPEFLAYAILPVVLYFYSLIFNSSGKKFVVYAFLASLFGAILTISHNFTVMFLMPIILAYLIVQIYTHKPEFKKIIWIAFSFLGSFGMGSFFIGPALLEQKFTRIGQGFLEWRDHFPTIGQLFKSDWGYFYSSSGTINDGMSFMLGYVQWLILGIGFAFIIYRIFKNKFKFWNVLKENIYIIFFFLLSLFTIYLILPISIPLWEKIRPLQNIQFSWRLLGVAVFTISALFSFLLTKIKAKYIYVGIFTGVSLLAVVGTRNFMLPQPISDQDLYRYDNFEKFHPHRYSTTTLGDDVLASSAKKACWFSTPVISTDKEETISLEVVEKGNTFGSVKFLIDKNQIKGDKIILALGYFPDIHKIFLNGEGPLDYFDCGGRVCFEVEKTRNGENFISWKVGQSKIENTFNLVTLAFFIVWLIVLFAYLTGIYKNKKNLTYYILIIITFILFLFFRSYNLPDRIGFGWDQERDAEAITNILSGKPTLLGPRVQGPNGFFLPPYFFYMLTPFYAIAGGSPFAMTGFIIAWSLLFFTTAFLILAKVFDRKTAVIFLALWAVNPLAVSIDTIAWNPVVIPLLFIALIYTIYLCIKSPKTKYFILAGLAFGLGTSFHLQFLFTAPIFIPLIIDIIKNRRLKNLVYLVISTVIPFLPIFIFDLRHNFLNLNRVMSVWGNASSYMVGSSPSKLLGFTIYLVVLIGFFIMGAKLKDKARGRILSGLGFVWAASLPLFYIFIKNPSEYYFNYLLVPFIIFLSLLLKNWKRFGILVLTGIVIYFIFQASPLFGDVGLGLKEKDQTVFALSKITKNSSPFNVSFDVPFNEDTGFRYLLKYYEVPVSGNTTDPLIEFVIPREKKPNTFAFGQIGIVIPKGWLSNNWPEKSE